MSAMQTITRTPLCDLLIMMAGDAAMYRRPDPSTPCPACSAATADRCDTCADDQALANEYDTVRANLVTALDGLKPPASQNPEIPVRAQPGPECHSRFPGPPHDSIISEGGDAIPLPPEGGSPLAQNSMAVTTDTAAMVALAELVALPGPEVGALLTGTEAAA